MESRAAIGLEQLQDGTQETRCGVHSWQDCSGPIISFPKQRTTEPVVKRVFSRRVSRQFTVHNMVSCTSYLWFMLIDRHEKGVVVVR